jgi:transmembrane sensor
MTNNKYSKYSVEDFILDPNFIKWVKDPDSDMAEYWQNVIAVYPKVKPLMDNAREMILAIEFDEIMTVQEKELLWKQIEFDMPKVIESKVVKIIPSNVHLIYKKALKFKVAAVLIILLTSGMLSALFYYHKRDIVIDTQFGEVKNIVLPDSSVITLNAHSSIRYNSGWNNSQNRVIWLDGEAYFSIRHKQNNQPFIVHASKIDIEVLGTEFNVSKRNEDIKISLNSGKIKLTNSQDNSQPIVMKPGDLVEIISENTKLIKRTVNPARYSAWKENKLLFDNTSVEEIIKMLKNTYGWEINVDDTSILSEKLSGEISTENELKLLNALSKTLEINIEKHGNTIKISKTQ